MEIIYVGDPMCSWCWGISNEVGKLKNAYDGRIGFRMMMGGLRPYTTEPMDAAMKKFLFHHWEKVHQLTGQPFSYKLLDRDDFVYNTEPPGRAVVTFRMIKPEATFDFFKAVQYAFYAENKDTHLLNTYLDLLPPFGVEATTFEKLYNSEKARNNTKTEYEMVYKMGVMAFPAVLMYFNDRWHLIANGFKSFAEMDEKVKSIIEN